MVAKGSMIPVAKPLMDEAEVEAAGRAIRSGWVTQGPEVAAFEREFAAFVGAPHACAVSSGTTALHLALLIVGVRPGDEVVTVSHSYIATANVVRYCGAVPVFVDVRPDTFNMDPTRIEEVVTPRTRAILCVHQIGMPCELEAILERGATPPAPGRRGRGLRRGQRDPLERRAGSASAGRTATSPASRSTRASWSRPATGA